MRGANGACAGRSQLVRKSLGAANRRQTLPSQHPPRCACRSLGGEVNQPFHTGGTNGRKMRRAPPPYTVTPDLPTDAPGGASMTDIPIARIRPPSPLCAFIQHKGRITMTTQTSRRAVLAGAAAVPALAVPAIATSATPIRLPSRPMRPSGRTMWRQQANGTFSTRRPSKSPKRMPRLKLPTQP
jgi:hypothetical protein